MKKKIFIIIALLFVGLPLVILTFLYIRAVTKPVLDDEARKSAPGSFIHINDGTVHYEIKGADSLPVVVLIHGGTVPYICWDENFDVIAEAGYRVLRYDLFGRGYSDRPKIRYTKGVYVNQLNELLSKLNITGQVHLAGISMGGAVAVFFTEAWPDRVISLTLIDPVGPYFVHSDKGELFKEVRTALKRLVSGNGKLDSESTDKIKPLLSRTRESMNYRGIERAIFSSVRNRSYRRLLNAYRTVGSLRRPVIVIWGENDPVLPVKYSNEVKKLIPDSKLHIIKNAGHIPHYEKPDTVNPILIDFFNSATL